MDFLIVGQGLAGSLLAWQLMERDQQVLVVDRDDTVTSSKVAAGLINPLSGRQFHLPEGLEEDLTFAKQLYRAIEERTGLSFFHPLEIALLFDEEKDLSKWSKCLTDSVQGSRYPAFCQPLNDIDPERLHAEFGGIEIHQGGWLAVPVFLDAVRRILSRHGAFTVDHFRPGEMEIHETGLRWKGIDAKAVIFCEGWQGAANPLFDWIPMNNARGDILLIRCLGLEEERRILNRNGWILPLGQGIFRAGATYDRCFLDESPTPQGREFVEEKIRHILKIPFEVLDHQSAVRPIIRQSHPYLGRHPLHSQIFYCNGLGSKGVLRGPRRTRDLVDHILLGRPLDPACDIGPFWRCTS